VVMLIVPPVLNIILFGFALNPTFENLRLGVVDDSRTPESRDLVSAFRESLAFAVSGYYGSREDLGRMISTGGLDAGLVIPRDFVQRRVRGEFPAIQLLVDAVNANTATIAGGYAARIVSTVNQRTASQRAPSSRADPSPLLTTSFVRDPQRA